jgi:uncharacterized membrane protein
LSKRTTFDILLSAVCSNEQWKESGELSVDWIDSQLRQWWILVLVCWIFGLVYFLVKRESRNETKEYWKKLKDVGTATFFITCMGAFFVIFAWALLKMLFDWIRN